jgi:hypothetical protein
MIQICFQRVVFDKTAFVKFKISYNFKQNIDKTDFNQPKIHASLWILKISRKKSANQKSVAQPMDFYSL